MILKENCCYPQEFSICIMQIKNNIKTAYRKSWEKPQKIILISIIISIINDILLLVNNSII